MTERKKITAKPISTKTLASYTSAKSSAELKIKILADDSRTMAEYDPVIGTAALVANLPIDAANEQKVQMPHRTTAIIDCGVVVWVPVGWRLLVNIDNRLARKGVIAESQPVLTQTIAAGVPGGSRISVIVTNVGRETVVIKQFDKFATLRLEPIHKIVWED